MQQTSPFTSCDDLTAGLLLNPTSRRNRKHFGEIIQVAESCPKLHCRITHGLDDVSSGLSDLADKSVDILAIGGGDGTVSRVLTHLMSERPFESLPLIAILPGGTANMTGSDVGFTGSVLAATRRLCDWLERKSGRASIRRRPILRVQPGASRAASYGMFFGAGAIVQGINFTNQNNTCRPCIT